MSHAPSIAGRITRGYYLIGALVFGIAAVAFFELYRLEAKVMAGEHVSGFLNATLELRRFEKNYLLYGQSEDLVEGLAYLAEARRLLDSQRASFDTVESTTGLTDLIQDMAEYERIARATLLAPPPQQAQALRDLGKQIVTRAETMAAGERRLLQDALTQSRRLLAIAVVLLVLGSLLIAHALSRQVVRPLQELEGHMRTIAEGETGPIVLASADREIRSLTEAFNRMLAELESRHIHLLRSQKLASLGTLLSGVAHELNNPLSNISSSTQILLEELDDIDGARLRQTLLQVDEQTERARRIVRALLEFARERRFQREALDLRTLLDDTLRFLRGQLPPGVRVEIDIPPGLAVHGDKQSLQQVLLNLLKNAQEAIGGRGTITVRARHPAPQRAALAHCSDPEHRVEIEIHDSGHGIAPEIISRVFDPFFTTKEVGKGAGLGLAIVHELIEEHEGCIAVESTEAGGTSFFVRLPLAEEPNHE